MTKNPYEIPHCFDRFQAKNSTSLRHLLCLVCRHDSRLSVRKIDLWPAKATVDWLFRRQIPIIRHIRRSIAQEVFFWQHEVSWKYCNIHHWHHSVNILRKHLWLWQCRHAKFTQPHLYRSCRLWFAKSYSNKGFRRIVCHNHDTEISVCRYEYDILTIYVDWHVGHTIRSPHRFVIDS